MKISHPKFFLLIALVLFGLAFPFLSYSDFTSLFSHGARLTRVGDGTAVGNLSGKFMVNPSGSAVYDIPISAPPGTAKMAPDLSLHYDSSSGNGILGMGFSLQGLTAITRVPSNVAQNGLIHGVDFSSSDRFALNGQQLVSTGGTYGADGTEYRTYIDSQARILSQGSQGNGPAGFVVQTKGGQTAWYGTTSDSELGALGTNDIAVWALAKIQDAAGNTIQYTYLRDADHGAYYPLEIDYTSNDTTSPRLTANHSLKFLYEDRPDPITTYTHGSLFKTTKRLSEIQSYQGSTLVSDYKLTYEVSPNTFRSRLINIQQCDGSGNCFRPLQFTWQTNEKGWVEAPQWKVPELIVKSNSDPHGLNLDMGFRFMDLKGRGIPDIAVGIAPADDPRSIENPYTQSYFNTGAGWQTTPAAYNLPKPILSQYIESGGQQITSGHFSDLQGNGQITAFTCSGLDSGPPTPFAYHVTYELSNQGWVPSSFNMIKLAEQFGFPPEIISSPIYAYQANIEHESNVQGNGIPFLFFSISYPACTLPSANGAIAKINGQWQNAPAYVLPSEFETLRCYANPSAEIDYSMGQQFMDASGNGLQDLILANDENRKLWLVNPSVDPSAAQSSAWSIAPYAVPDKFRFVIDSQNSTTKDGGGRVTNLSGSGLPDLIMGRDGDHENWINTGWGWIPGPSPLNPPTDVVHSGNGQWYDNGVEMVDVTGSGQPAWLQCSGSSNGGKCQAWINQNGAWVLDQDPPDQNTAPPVQITDAQGHDNGVRFVDLLGTGFEDIVINNGTQSDAWLNKAQTKPDVITNVQDALGDNLQIQYKPLTHLDPNGNPDVYTKASGAQAATYPNMDVIAPIYVVSQTSSDTDVTPTTIASIAKKIEKLVNTNAVQHITSYKYANAVFNHLGWGFLGFGRVTTTDQFTGISTTVTYSQDTDHRTQGMPIGTVTMKSDGTIINTQTSTFSTKVFGDQTRAPNASWYFPYVSQTIEKGFDFNTGTQISTKTTTTQMDDYGNPTDILETDVDQLNGGTYTTETQNTYANHPDNTWRLGELTQAVVTATSPNISMKSPLPLRERSREARVRGNNDITSITRTSTFTYDTNGFLHTSTIEPNSTTNQLTKTYTRDGFGNMVQTDMTGANIDPRSEKVQYDPTGTFIIAKTNALNQTTSYQVDPRFGVITQTTDPNGLIETNTLDGFGRITSTTHPDKTVSNVTYQWTNGNDPAAPQGSVYEVILTSTDPSGTPNAPEKISYHDELDREIAQTMQGFVGNSTSAAPWIWQLTNYDQLGRIVSKTLPFFAGTSSDQIYLSSNQYDALGRVILTTNADGSTVTQSYNGYTTTTTNPKNQTTIRTTNIRGNLIQTLDTENHKTTYQYDAFNNLIQLTDSKGNVSTMTYDNLGRKLAMNDVDRGKSTYTYDALGELLSQTDANQNTTTFNYDLLGRMLARTDSANTPNATTSTWQYDTAQNGIGKLASENGVSNVGRAKAQSAVPAITAPTSLQILNAAKDNLLNYTKTFAYDGLSRPISNTINLQGQTYTTSTTYDENGRVDTITYPNKVSLQNHYDPDGYLWQVTDNSASSKTKNNSGVAYSTINSMNAAGHVMSMTHSNGLITNYTYDPKTNFLTDIQTNASTGLQLERQLLPQIAKQQEDQEKENGKDWTLAVNAKSTNDPNADQTGVAKVDALFNSPALSSRPGTGQDPRPMDGNGSLPSLHDTGPIQNLHYDYDTLGNVNDKHDNVLNVQDNYQYDDLNRLTQDQTVDNAHGQTTNLNYQYDELGNITNKSDVGTYTYGTGNTGPNTAGPHAVTSINGLETDTFTYDANGNQTQALMQTPNGNLTRNISYTTFDVPKTLTQTNDKTNVSATVNFYYNADRKRFMRQDQVTAPDPTTGNLVTTKTTTLYLDGMEIDTTIDQTGKITNQYKNYIGDSELITDDQGATQRYDILKDNIGSTSVITDQNGNVTQRFHYDPFGEQQLVPTASERSPLPSAGEVAAQQRVRGNDAMTPDRTALTKYGFTGQEEVAAGNMDLIHMNGRMYDPHLGRFLSADPTIQDPSNSQSLNRYTYCLNDPLALTDPSGFSWWSHFWHDVGHLFDGAGHTIGNWFKNQTFDTLLEIAAAAIAVGTLGPGATALEMFGHFAGAAAFNGVISYAQTGSIGLARVY